MIESTRSIELESLANAIREGNEDTALSIAGKLITASKCQGRADGDASALKESSKIAWPSSFLWRAVWLNMVQLATLLLNYGMDPDPTDRASEFFPSPLYMAARLCHPLIMDALIEHGARLDANRLGTCNSIYTTAANGNVHGIDSLVAKDSSLLEVREPETPLYVASLQGNWNVVKRLLELGADPNSGVGPRPNYRWAPLVAATELTHIKTARILLEHKADPNICGPRDQDTPLWFAAVKAANVDFVRLLLENGADPNHELLDPSLLIEIITSTVPTEHSLPIFDILADNSPPVLVNVADEEGMTPLLYAAEAGELSTLTWLLEHEADVDATDNQGCGALFHAINNTHAEIVRELLNWKPQLNILTTDG